VCFPCNEAHGVWRELSWIQRSRRHFAAASFPKHLHRTLWNEADTEPGCNEIQDGLPAAYFKVDLEGLLSGPIAPVLELLAAGSVWFGKNERQLEQFQSRRWLVRGQVLPLSTPIRLYRGIGGEDKVIIKELLDEHLPPCDFADGAWTIRNDGEIELPRSDSFNARSSASR
jgi:hypothetical protein